MESRDRLSSQISTFWETWRGGRFWCSRRRGASRANAWSATTTGSSSSWPTSLTASSCPTTCTATSREGSRSGSASSRRGCSCTPSLTTSGLRLLSKHSLAHTADSSGGSLSVPVSDQCLNVALMQVHATWWSSGPSRADFGELPAEVSKDPEEAAVPLWWENFCLTLFLVYIVYSLYIDMDDMWSTNYETKTLSPCAILRRSCPAMCLGRTREVGQILLAL